MWPDWRAGGWNWSALVHLRTVPEEPDIFEAGSGAVPHCGKDSGEFEDSGRKAGDSRKLVSSGIFGKGFQKILVNTLRRVPNLRHAVRRIPVNLRTVVGRRWILGHGSALISLGRVP